MTINEVVDSLGDPDPRQAYEMARSEWRLVNGDYIWICYTSRVRSVRNRIRRLAKSSFVCVADIGNPAIINVYWYAYRVDYFYALQKTKRC